MHHPSRREFIQGSIAASAVSLTRYGASQPTQKQSLLLFNGKIATMDRIHPFAEAILLEAGVVKTVGTNREVRNQASGTAKRIDLGGRTVIPGLNDSHMHFVRGSLSYNLDTRWDGIPTLKEALAKLTAQAKRTPPGQWVRVGGGWSEFQFAEKRMPSLAELNAAVPDRPCYVLHFYQSSMLNRKGTEALGYGPTTPVPAGGSMERDTRGKPTGLLLAHPLPAAILAPENKMPPLSASDSENSIQQFVHELNRLGLTSVVDPGGVGQPYPAMYGPLQSLSTAGKLNLRLGMYLLPQDSGHELSDVQGWLQSLKLGDQTDGLRFAGVGEILVGDGTDWDLYTQPRVSMPSDLEQQITPIVQQLIQRRWPFRIHATFDDTLDKYLTILEKIDKQTSLKNSRWCFDHAELASQRSLERIRALGGGIAIQHRAAFHGEYAEKYYGSDRLKQAPPVVEMLKLGIPVGAGTDATRDTSFNPWVCLKWLVTGRTVGGLQTAEKSNCLDRMTALRLYTQGSAWFTGEELHKGGLVPGQFADLAVLDQDFFSIPEERINALHSKLTVLGGIPVYGEGEFSRLAPAAPAVSPRWSPATLV